MIPLLPGVEHRHKVYLIKDGLIAVLSNNDGYQVR